MPPSKSILFISNPLTNNPSIKAPRRKSVASLSAIENLLKNSEFDHDQRHIRISSATKLHNKLSKSHIKLFQSQSHSKQSLKNIKRIVSARNSQKFSSPQQFKIEERTFKKYLINEPKSTESSKNLQKDSRKSKFKLSSLENKNLSNQALLNFSSNKSPSQTKLIKKAPNHLKGRNSLQPFNKSFSLLPDQKNSNATHLYNFSQIESQRKKKRNQAIETLQNVDSFNSKELQVLKLSHKSALTQINQTLMSLINQAGQRNSQRLEDVMNGYQKIICELYNELKIQDQKKSKKGFKKTHKSHESLTPNNARINVTRIQSPKNTNSTSADLSMPSMEEAVCLQSILVSKYSTPKHASSYSSDFQVKKLNLTNLKHSFHVKDYHEEFLQMRENFSESWKRQLQKERKI